MNHQMKPKICFISLGSYSLFTSNEYQKYVGGAELKQVLIAKALAERNYDISFITYDEEGEKKASFKDINIVKTYPQSNDFNVFYKIRLLWKAYKKANSDIYLQSGGFPGLIALFCFMNKRKYIKWIASDRNVELKIAEEKTPLFLKILLYFDIKLSSMIIAQNEYQKQVLDTRYKKRNVIIKNPIYIPKEVAQKNGDEKEKCVVWISTIRSIKQPEIFLKIAQKLPNYKFKMIGGRSGPEPDLYDKIGQEAKKIRNLEFLGFIPYDKIQKYYEESTILVNTSKAEGFPNIFLEAWLYSLPVVSLSIDPDEIICKEKLGFHSKSIEQMIIDIEVLLHDDGLRKEMGIQGKKYVEQNHDIHKVTDQFVDLLTSCVS
jgi:glycosyltransferase involved in cell wall biosynthesis